MQTAQPVTTDQQSLCITSYTMGLQLMQKHRNICYYTYGGQFTTTNASNVLKLATHGWLQAWKDQLKWTWHQ